MPTNHSNAARKQKWAGYRSLHRMRQHQAAHAAGADHAIPPPLDHPLVAANDPEVVARPAEMERLIDELRHAGSFGYDSEFIGEHSYYPKLCLIQVATSKRVTLIDPLTGLDLEPFWRLVADTAIKKIVHAGLQDLEPVFRHLNEPARNVFDTQLAAAFTGLAYPASLENLVGQLIGADLGGGPKFTQWDQRPLSLIQLRYAANDVRYLPLLHQVLDEKLEAIGNALWAAEECGALSDPALYRFQSQRLRLRGVESLKPRQRTVLDALATWRDKAARIHDLPPRTLLRDQVLFDLCRDPVKSCDGLKRVRGLPRPVRERWGKEMLAVIRAALCGPVAVSDDGQKLSRQKHRVRIESLWSAIVKHCHEYRIDPAVVANKHEVARLVCAVIAGRPVPSLRLARGWRGQLLGPVLDSWRA